MNRINRDGRSRRTLTALILLSAILVHSATAAESNDTSRARTWALEPLKPPAVPPLGKPSFGNPIGPFISARLIRKANPIDAFISARLITNGLALGPETDRAKLIRRLSFDLIGLPPTPDDIDQFIEDALPNAYERLVDRLLASPRYGERWGRHWLDVVRYTESQGFEYDKLRDNAWHYRDYVIKSFNDDKPYDEFMREQIAGDVLEPITSQSIIAASLLVCGAWDEAGNGQANATQKAITREEELEDLIGTVAQTFLGLTVNCARCHDHKFDPIPHVEYYRIKSVFEGVKHGERTIATPSEVKAREEQIALLKKQIAEAEISTARLEAEGSRIAAAKPHQSTNELAAPLVRWTFDGTTNTLLPGELKGGASITNGRLQLAKAGAYFRSASLPHDVREKTLEAWVSLANLEQGGGAPISIESEDGGVFDAIVFGERQPKKWIAGSSNFQRTRDLDAPAETARADEWIHVAAVYRADNSIALFRNGVLYGQRYTPESSLQTFKTGSAHVLLGMRHKGGGKAFLTGEIKQAALYDRALTDAEVTAAYRASGVSREEALAILAHEQRREYDEAVRQSSECRKRLDSMKPLPVSYAGTRVQPAPTHRLKRGDVKSPQEFVSPGALSAIAELDADFGLPANAPEAQRRLKFADWLTDRRNPLPARVMANRVWHFHFGQGLVATPNDFGVSGAKPSHPELLDWLATQFIANGWSVKALHRLIVTSATYRQSSRYDGAAAARDADNQLLWRFSPRRLEAEALRDAMLAVSGEINWELGGPSFRPFDVLKFPANTYLPVDKTGPEFNRRTVYRMNVNSGKAPMLDAFDCPDPSVKTPRRGVTTTPSQALALMNDSFAQRQAEKLAARASFEKNGEVAKSIQTAYRYALGRSPNQDGLQRARKASEDRGLAHVCWALLNSTEFVYVQ